MYNCGRCHKEFESHARAFKNKWICPECFDEFRPILAAYLNGQRISVDHTPSIAPVQNMTLADFA